jgi:GT2 family glycosyltransferase
MGPADLSAVVCTKDRPERLRLVLLGLAAQDPRPGEVVVADSGETSARAVAREVRDSTGLEVGHVSRPTRTHEAAATRNAGARAARGRRLVFVDGDCVPLPGFVRAHLRAAAAPGGGCAVPVGGFVRLDAERSRAVTPGAIGAGSLIRLLTGEELGRLRWLHRKNRLYSMVRHPKRPALRSGNFSVSAHAFRAVNGFDETFVGWGQEDDDLGRRLRRWGAGMRSVTASAVCLHLWHEPHPTRPTTWREGVNVPYLERRDRPVRCRNGLVRETG